MLRSSARTSGTVVILLLALSSCRRADRDVDAGAPNDAAVTADAGAPSDAGTPSPDAGTSAEDAAALLVAIDYAATVAALTAGPLVSDAGMVDAAGDAGSDASIRDRVENGVATNSIVDDPTCAAFDWTGRTAVITFTGCTSETTGLAIDGTVTLAVTFRPTTFTVTLDALTIGGTTLGGSLALSVGGTDTMRAFLVNADLSWTEGAGVNAVSLTDLAVAVDAAAMTTALDGAFAVTVGATTAAGTLEGVTWQMSDCHPSSGDARFTIDGGREVVATFLPATPIDGTVSLAVPPLPPVDMVLLPPCG